jgi:NTP pyrophosphatase (non-canonical NTP hydrolase)
VARLSEDTKTIALPRLNNLKPSLESTALKLLEEAGEMAALIGKFRGMSGERVTMDRQQVVNEISAELLDVAQTAVTMMFVLEAQYQVDLHALIDEHIRKLLRKGYLRLEA